MVARVFEPVIFTMMKTDGKNHSEDIYFKISYGFELSNYECPVFKVQMVSDGKVKGRQAPSYSDDDFDRVIEIRNKLKTKFYSFDEEYRKNMRDLEIFEKDTDY